MEQATETPARKPLGRIIGIVVFACAALALLLAVIQTDRYPRTDDASVRANFIQIAPEVSGRLVDLPRQGQRLRQEGWPPLRHRPPPLPVRP